MMTELNQRLSQLQAYLAADPANPHLLLELADLHMQAGSQHEHEAALQRLFAVAPGHMGGRILQGVGLMRQGRLDEAVAVFQALRGDGGDDPALCYNLAYALMLQGRYEEAEPQAAMAAKSLALLPQAGPLHVRALHFLGRLEDAVLVAESALQRHPEHLSLYGLLATLYLDQENLAAAERVARQVLELAPADPDAATVLGMLALSKQDLTVAGPLLRQACASKPNSGRAQMGLGLVSMLEGQLDEAESKVVQALRAMPGHVGSWHVLAWCRILSNRPLEAKEALQEALRLDRNFADTHGGLAIVEIMEGRLQEAQQSVRRALGLNAGSFPAQYAQSLLLQSAGQAEQARAIHERLLNSEVLPDGTKLNEAVAKAMALSSS
ncbi:Flp pilus assembly protein TadD [Chromobacterium alkanivorans]|uniref:tetratricopeptide repeat protein n=1 Tax=Chromobacterium alkanivorans TaxID=1071719 RepID=UPI00216A2CA9|nr:tetratricopeptide repeat protein [Chromobacterium alkanivorans]MCS3806386.1 Flp pilus assembly protein TadD [Chromobacterium alkanivorans]MCS3820602.1 Flp pilus assembly protein TadD [Chromobacterium alkanivorans]MCS3875360.1 Flp pilus assembly protein TadD [Chromobacterium alkanivorans]